MPVAEFGRRRARWRRAMLGAALLGGTAVAGFARAQSVEAPSQSTAPPSQTTGQAGSGGSAEDPDTYMVFGLRAALTYSDNLNLARSAAGERGGAVLEVSPYALWRTQTDRVRSSGTVALRNFARSVGESGVGRLEGFANALVRLAGEWAWLDVSGRSTTISGGTGIGTLSYDPSFYAPPNVASREFRTLSVSPFIRERAGWLDYELRYRYITTNNPFPRTVKDTHQLSANANTGARFGRWNFSFFGIQSRNVLGDGRDFGRRVATLTAGYLVNPELRVGVSANYEQIDFLRGPDGRDWGVGPGVFFDWRPNSRLSLGASWSDRFYGRNVSAQMAWRNRNVALALSYLDAVLTSADASALFFDPASIGNASAGGVPFSNPLLNNRIFQELLLQQLLLFGVTPFDLAFNTASLARTQQLTLTSSVTGQSNTLSLSLSHSQRDIEANFSQAVSSPGGVITLRTGLEGEIKQTSAIARLSHQLDGRTTVALTGRRTIVETDGNTVTFAGTGRTTLTQLAVSYGFRITQDVTAGVALRRTQQRFEGSIGSQYTENAVTGLVDVRF